MAGNTGIPDVYIVTGDEKATAWVSVLTHEDDCSRREA